VTNTYRGQCHCGNIEVTFESEKSPEELAVRACGCSFCRGHGARTTTDPDGSARIEVADAGRLSRYRFGLKTADFLVCGDCGAYMGALFEDDDGSAYVTLNTRYFENPEAYAANPGPVHYEGEPAAGRRARRRKMWTPVAAMREG
jgi:hypothetical protein